jgi:hypothetical protein
MSKKTKNERITRRTAIEKAIYIPPTILSLTASPAFAQQGSGIGLLDGIGGGGGGGNGGGGGGGNGGGGGGGGNGGGGGGRGRGQ